MGKENEKWESGQSLVKQDLLSLVIGRHAVVAL
jgi:hypothetical protein